MLNSQAELAALTAVLEAQIEEIRMMLAEPELPDAMCEVLEDELDELYDALSCFDILAAGW